MANDREILREIWEGKLPVCFKLDPDEINQVQEPDPFYLMVPRLSYFPLVTEKVQETNVNNTKIVEIRSIPGEKTLSTLHQ